MKKRNLVRLIVSSCLAMLLATGALAAPLQSQLENKTTALAALAQRYLQAVPASQQALLEQLLNSASERRQLLAETVAENPGAILRTALPAALVESLPPQVQAQLEKRAEVEGELEILYEDYEDHHVLRHVLKANGKRIGLYFNGQAPGLQTGARVRARGVLVDGDMVVASPDVDLEIQFVSGEDSSGSGGSSVAPLSNTFGEQRTVVLLVNFQDQIEEPITVADANSLVFDQVGGFMAENSYGQTSFAGDTFGWYTLPISSSSSTSDIATAARDAATAAGVDLSQYDRYAYFFPRSSTYSWNGAGTIGGNPSETWINGSFVGKDIAHELGHNFGLYHSRSLECGDEVVSEAGQPLEYGDIFDTMGNQNLAHFNAFQKQRLGWLDYGASPPVTTVESSGSYSIELQESPGTNPKAMKVLRSQDPDTGAKSWFYVEYRQDVGYDSFLAGNANVLGGVIIHLVNDADVRGAALLDMTPASSTMSYYDWRDPALVVGQSYTDPESGVTISPEWADGSGVAVQVSYGGGQTPSCVRANPAVAISPGQSPWVTPGTSVSFDVTVTNNDSDSCSSATFDLSSVVPAGWAASYAQSSLSLAPGASGTVSLAVTSDTSAIDGFYDIVSTASNSADTASTGSATATYVVSGGANEAPVAVNDTAVTAERTSVDIAVLANDSDPDGDPLSVAGVTNGASGKVTINADGTVTYAPKGRFKGTDTFTYTVSDGSASAIAQVTVTVGSESDGGGKGGGGGKNKK